MVELDLFVITPVAAAFVGMAVAFISIWSNIKSTRVKAKAALEKNTAELKADLRDYVTLKLQAMDAKVEAVKNEIKLESMFTNELNRRSTFFTNWAQRLEDRIERASASAMAGAGAAATADIKIEGGTTTLKEKEKEPPLPE